MLKSTSIKWAKIIIFMFISFCFVTFFLNFSSVYGVDLEFNIGTEVEGGVIIRTFSKAYSGSIEFFDSQGVSRGKFITENNENEYAGKGYRYNQGDSVIRASDYNYAGTSLNYSSAGIQFQKDGIMTSNYTSGGSTMTYALQTKQFVVEEITNDTQINLSDYTYHNNTNYNMEKNLALTQDKYKRYRINNAYSGFRMLRWTITQNGTSVSDWFIPYEYIEEIQKAGYIQDGKVRFSLWTSVMANCYEQFCDVGYYANGDTCEKNSILDSAISGIIFAISKTLEHFGDENTIDLSRIPVSSVDCPCSNLNKDPVTNTNSNIRKEAYSAKEAYDITVYGQGVGFNTGTGGLRGIDDSNKSLANNYDNWLILDSIIENIQKNVYIRHVDINTGELLDISNVNEVVKRNDGSVLLKQPDSRNIKAGGQYTYQEAYLNLDANDSVTASRSTTLAKNNKVYTYKGVKIGKSSDIATAEANMNKCPLYSYQEVSDNTSDDEYVTITFYYSQANIIRDEPKIFIDQNTSTGGDCKTIEVSGSEQIKPYIVTPTYTLKNLVYEKSLDSNNKIKYNVKDFVINKVQSMNIVNSDGYNYNGKTISGNIISTSREALFEFNSNSLKLNYDFTSVNSEINSKYEQIKTASSLANIDVNSIKGANTVQRSFSSNYSVRENAYNGLRYVKGQVSYADYNVKNNTNSNTTYVDAKNRLFVNVHNDINVSVNSVSSPNVVDHSTQEGYVIQKNAEFVVELNSDGEKYLDKYFLIFNFEVKYNGREYKKNTWIEVDASKNKNTEFRAIATNSSDEGDIVSQTENYMIVVGMSNNVPNGYKDYVFNQFDENTLTKVYSSTISSVTLEKMNKSSNKVTRDNVCNQNITLNVNNNSSYTSKVDLYEDIYYFAWTKTTFKTLSRIYDFKVTDCLDVNYKSVFRKSDDKSVNSLTGIQYFSGIKELKIYGSSYNVLETRKFSKDKTILPLGPYKHTDSTYIFAPKLGYRISFDLKTSGYYNYGKQDSGRKVLIKPSYYYISKDGSNFIDNINIYYKNSEGKYQQFVNSNYSIYFTPNDGYRYINNLATTANVSNMANKLTELKISSKDGFYITPSMMATSDNNFIQSWYGEFKLPNSAIAVNGTNVNKPLTEGYIGVRFEISCIDTAASNSGKKEIVTSYNVPNASLNGQHNTTQWDYEGYLGFSSPGNKAEGLQLQLEKGTWEINDDMYQKIKGTVILYDIDSRAAEDFD